MMQVLLLVLMTGAIILFSFQNAGPVLVSFLIWEFELSLVSVTMMAVLAGVVIAQLLHRLRATPRKHAHNPDL